MSKLSRTMLKSIVKECLIEILAEGLVDNEDIKTASRQKKSSLKESLLRAQDISSQKVYKASSNKINQTRRTHLDKISYDNNSQLNDNDRIVGNKISTITSDPVMNEILADTLKRQSVNESKCTNPQILASGDRAAKIVDQANPEDLFGLESAGKWAELAFAPSITKKN